MRSGLLKRYFLTGLLVLVPICGSALILTGLFNLLDSWAEPITERYFGFHVPGLGIAVLVVVILVTGAVSSNMIGRWLVDGLEHLLSRIPVVKPIYNTIHQVVQAFSPGGQNAFQSVVLVDHPRTGVLGLGFVTHEIALETDGTTRPHVAVYLPTNHLYLGDTFLVDAERVLHTSLTVQQGIQCVISAGATLPADLEASSGPQAAKKSKAGKGA
jgi:uncharacterized membrane protein